VLPPDYVVDLEREPRVFLVNQAILTSVTCAQERMMVEEFGDEYAAYSARTKRLIPGVW
jgi:protein-S-isoprenylcysteine O-methyltransferase Ste14